MTRVTTERGGSRGRHLLLLVLVCALAILGIAWAWVGVLSAAEVGKASWYDCCHTRADGKRFNPADSRVCAHKTLPFGTKIRITVLKTGRSLDCVVRDRGPYARGRIVDVTRAGADALRIRKAGVVRVKLVRLR